MTKVFSGVYTALITPFTASGLFDRNAFQKLIDFQIENGVDGIVILGTTGESPTVSPEEHIAIIASAVEIARGRTTILAGVGSNSTEEAIFYSQQAEAFGADALLHVVPYYNKPTQKGLYEHFFAIAHKTNLPILLYNIPGRTGVNMEIETLLRLSEIPNIQGVKEASGNVEQVRKSIEKLPNDFSVLSGNDDQNLDILKLGGDGTVSVLSNVFPRETKKIVDFFREGDIAAAESLSNLLADFVDALFIETNPIPVKTMLAHLGMCEEIFRLPLTTMEPKNRERLLTLYESLQKDLLS